MRPIYEPVGKGDSYFPTELYDAMALAYGHQAAGDDRLAHHAGRPSPSSAWTASSPTRSRQNLTSETGGKYTGSSCSTRETASTTPTPSTPSSTSVKYQYGCFFATFLKTGKASVLAPKPLGTPCE